MQSLLKQQVSAALARHMESIQELSEARPQLAFGRSDSRFANIIARTGGRVGIVDWEDSGLIDPALDQADLMVHANQEDLLSAGEWEAFLRPYLAAVADLPGLAVLLVVEHLAAMRGGFQPERSVE